MNKALLITSSQENYRTILNEIYKKITKNIAVILISEKEIPIIAPKIYHINSNIFNIKIIDEIEKIIKKEMPDIIISTSQPDIKNIIARIAVRFECGVLSDIVEIVNSNYGPSFFKYAYGGNYRIKLSIKTSPAIITLKTTYSDNKDIIEFENSITNKIQPEYDESIKLIETQRLNNKIPLENAKKVIGIGRGVKPEDYHLIERFASLINASVGYTRPVIHSGVGDPEYQIGITGKIISPQLYIAIGISGKQYHIKGVERAKKIIAINTDPNAEIKNYSDIFINCDYKTFLNKIFV